LEEGFEEEGLRGFQKVDMKRGKWFGCEKEEARQGKVLDKEGDLLPLNL